MGPGRRRVKHRFLLMRDPRLRDHRRESGSFRRRQARSRWVRSRTARGGRSERGQAVLGELSVALRYPVSIVAFVVEVIPMRRFLRHLVVGSTVLFLGPVAHAWGQTDSKLDPSPSGFANSAT